jgi:hypothetical protein
VLGQRGSSYRSTGDVDGLESRKLWAHEALFKLSEGNLDSSRLE